jgi:Uma2 family endonuclease
MTTQSLKPRQGSAQTDAVLVEPLGPIVLRLDPIVQLTNDVLAELSSLNETLRIEKNAEGELEVLPPGNITAGNQNSLINRRLGNWAEEDGTGEVFDSSSGFTLPNGAIRGPDASWVLKNRLAELTDEEKIRGFARISPDFVVELRSNSDSLSSVRRKMEEYVENGVRLGWLIDPLDPQHRVYIYRPGAEVEILEAPESLSGDPELPGFTLDLKPVWEPAF